MCQSCMHLQRIFSLITAIFSGSGRLTITSVTVGAGHDLINVTFVQVSYVTCDDDRLLSTIYNNKVTTHAVTCAPNHDCR